ncbi:MAG: hypothetical protein WC998_07160 [Candidatus Paceibacterota bacterium]|jgi:hypothetical protein
MIQYLQYIVFLGAAISFSGTIFYIKETLSGDTKPNKVTWLMWSMAPIIATFAAVSDGVGWSVLPVFMAGFGPLLVFISSFVNKNSYWKLEIFDYVCCFLSALALVFWFITKEPAITIIFAIASDGFAAVPTLIKSWKSPKTETGYAYIAGILAALTSFVAITTWNFSSYAFPLYLIFINTCLIFSVYKNKLKLF